MRLAIAILMTLMLQTGAYALSGGSSGGSGGGGNNGGHGASSSGGMANRFVMLFNRSDNEDEETELDDADDDPRVFTLPALVAPLSSDGRLTGFAYVHVRVRAADGQNVWAMQENAHYALDALVRGAFRIPVSTPDGRELDRERAAEVWADILREQYGANAVDRVEIRSADTRLFRR